MVRRYVFWSEKADQRWEDIDVENNEHAASVAAAIADEFDVDDVEWDIEEDDERGE